MIGGSTGGQGNYVSNRADGSRPLGKRWTSEPGWVAALLAPVSWQG